MKIHRFEWTVDVMLVCLEHLQPLSDEIHFRDEEHNSDYDHEAFLGRDHVQEFDEMAPDDSKEQLGYDVTKVCLCSLYTFIFVYFNSCIITVNLAFCSLRLVNC